jgi:hypothetical protein
MKLTLLLVSGLLILLSGCAAQHTTITPTPGTLGRNKATSPQFRVAVLAGDSTPATYSFQKAKGQLGSAREGISESAEMAVTGPVKCVVVSGDILEGTIRSAPDQGWLMFGAAVSGAAAGATAVGVAVVAPAIAAKGLVRSWKTVSPRELTERAADLDEALKQVATQVRFRQLLLASAQEECPGRMVAMVIECKDDPPNPSVDAVLEARIDQLRLERARSDEGSYFLRIKAHARLVRRDEGGVLYEQSVEYRSGRALFLDWTEHGAVECVADTGYRALAEYFVSQLR